ncbi:STAS domain-containing protein [Streptosporangium sp. NPDC050855]|uniref:STAS domain-containing protein n=1 Tax=Streptosporangium sp. NPDC050855 TaxID=3366194 RepID=UPI003792F943
MTSAVQLDFYLDPTLPDVLIVVLGGELDYTTAEHLRYRVLELLEGGHRHLVLDVGAVTFCDSTGLRIFLDLRTVIIDRGGITILSDLTPQLERTFAMTGLSSYFTLQPTRADALALLRASTSSS